MAEKEKRKAEKCKFCGGKMKPVPGVGEFVCPRKQCTPLYVEEFNKQLVHFLKVWHNCVFCSKGDARKGVWKRYLGKDICPECWKAIESGGVSISKKKEVI